MKNEEAANWAALIGPSALSAPPAFKHMGDNSAFRFHDRLRRVSFPPQKRQSWFEWSVTVAIFSARNSSMGAQFLDAVSDRSSEASLRYEEAKLLSRGSVDEQDRGTIGRITFLYYIGWDDFPLAIFEVLPLV
jgi:hypothetical protein